MKHWLITTGLLILLFAIVPMVWPASAHPQIWVVLCIGAAPSFIVARVNAYMAGKNSDDAFLYQMGTLMFRMLFSLLALAAFLYLLPQTWDQKIVAVCWFFLAYACYAAVEVKAFLSNLRRN